MNPITLLTDAVNSLWFWTYSIIAGWGVTFTLLVSAVIFLGTKLLKLTRKVRRLEDRLIAAERDYNLSVDKWQKR